MTASYRIFFAALVVISLVSAAAGFSFVYQSHLLAQDCSIIQDCPASLNQEIAQLADSGVVGILVSLAILVGSAYVILRPPQRLIATGKWWGPRDPRPISEILREMASSIKGPEDLQKLDQANHQLERTLDAQVADFEATATRSAVILGAVSLVIAADVSNVLVSPSLQQGWGEYALFYLLASAFFLLICIVLGWGYSELLIEQWSSGLTGDERTLKLNIAITTADVCAKNASRLSWIQTFFYVGASLWLVGVLLLFFAWLFR